MKPPLPLPDERIYPPYKIGVIVDILKEQGVSPEDCLRGSAVAVEDLSNAFALTSVSQYLIVCENAVSLSRDPAIAFEAGTRLHLSAYGIYGYALMSCMSLRDYFRLAVKYRRLTTPPTMIEFMEHADTVVWTFPEVFVSNPSRKLREFLIELQFSVNITHLQEVAGRKHSPLQACFSYPPPQHAHIYPKYLGCPCLFDQPRCELIYDNSILDQKPQMAHQLTAALVQEMCDQLIGQTMEPENLSTKVYQILVGKPGELPSMDTIAHMLNMSSRTLRRHLEMEGTSFQAIIDDVRCSLALKYLKTTRMSTSDIAMLLGFSDAANFRRALKRWTGKGAEELRR
ncbi:AraC family transcriptional regulator [Thauera sp. SDU_THAU2]|uniref:AraC family transcriptional regulator n=1 Tax=Thauera sp. SDU_THAU2 TaxID=3136633 RepID=UPI00311DDA63